MIIIAVPIRLARSSVLIFINLCISLITLWAAKQGRPECLRLYLWFTRPAHSFRAGPTGAAGTRPSLRPLHLPRANEDASLGRDNAPRERGFLRDVPRGQW